MRIRIAAAARAGVEPGLADSRGRGLESSAGAWSQSVDGGEARVSQDRPLGAGAHATGVLTADVSPAERAKYVRVFTRVFVCSLGAGLVAC